MKKNLFYLSLVLMLLVVPRISWAKSIGWISDIHAGSKNLRNTESENGNIQEPKNYGTSLNSVLKEMKTKGIDKVIVSGDMLNTGERKYISEIKKIAKNYGMKMFWVKGNHDKENGMKEFGQRYYYQDYDGFRIIVLDNTEVYDDFYGGFSQTQIDWLKQALKTSNQIVISMHIPIFSRRSEGHVLLERYREFESLISSSGNVKLVLFGHFHDNYETELNGVKYKIIQPLNNKNQNRYYGIVNLENYSAIYYRAKAIDYEGVTPRYLKNYKNKVKIGNFTVYSGSNFSKNNQVKLFLFDSGGVSKFLGIAPTNRQGKFSLRVKVGGLTPGRYNWYAVDMRTGKKSDKKYYTVVE